MGDSISVIGGDNWGLSTYQTFPSVYEFAASSSVHWCFPNRADKRNNFRTILAVCVIGLFFTVWSLANMPSYQGPLPMLLWGLFVSFNGFASALVLKTLRFQNFLRMSKLLCPLFFVSFYLPSIPKFSQQPLNFIVRHSEVGNKMPKRWKKFTL